MEATFRVDKQPWTPAPGSNAIEGSFSLSYPLGSNGKKFIQFNDNTIEVDVRHPGEIIEVIPLLVEPENNLTVDNHQIVLQRKNSKMIIEIDSPAEVIPASKVFDTHGGKAGRVIEIRANEKLKYSIQFTSTDKTN